MTIQQKIALKAMAQKVSRGILTQAQGRELFTKITGRGPDEEPADDDAEGQQLGKLMAAMAGAYPLPSGPDPDQQKGPAAELIQQMIQVLKNNPVSDKRTRKNKPAQK